mgnify:CR=1 FL=1
MQMQYLFFLIFVISCSQSTNPKLPEPLEGDLAISTQTLPGVVKVLSNVACTGAFVSPRAVLTAAHCLQQGGPYHIRSHGINLTTTKAYAMAQTAQSGKNDLGILVMDPPIAPEKVVPIGRLPKVGETLNLIGYGCNNTETRGGAGIKRMGTNVLVRIRDYLELSTPLPKSKNIIGPKNRAGSCFGDSGSPLLKRTGDIYNVVGVDHGALIYDEEQLSVFVNLYDSDNRNFIESVNAEENLGISYPN